MHLFTDDSDSEAPQTLQSESTQLHHRALELSQMFNAHMSLENMIKCNCFVLIDREHEYEIIISGNIVVMSDGERYVHPNDFAIEKVLKRRLNRCFDKIPSCAIKMVEKYPVHSKKCRLLHILLWIFVLFASFYYDSDSEAPQTLQSESTQLQNEDDGHDDMEVAIDPKEERAEAAKETFEASLALVLLDAGSSINNNENENERGNFVTSMLA